MLLAKAYNLFDPSFFAGLTGQDLLMADLTILGSINKEEAEANEKHRKRQQDERDHPGMERFSDESEFWDEAEAANNDSDKG